MSQEPNISNFLNGKPSIEPVAPSALFSRLRTFLPQMEQANRNIPEGSAADAFEIEKGAESSSDDSSDEEDVAEAVEDVGAEKTKKKKDSEGEDVEMDEQKNPQPARIEIDLDVFLEQNSLVDPRDVSVQQVDTLPTAFQAENAIKELEKTPKKPLIEEM